MNEFIEALVLRLSNNVIDADRFTGELCTDIMNARDAEYLRSRLRMLRERISRILVLIDLLLSEV